MMTDPLIYKPLGIPRFNPSEICSRTIGLLAWISTDKNLTNMGLIPVIHLTREFGPDCYPK